MKLLLLLSCFFAINAFAISYPMQESQLLLDAAQNAQSNSEKKTVFASEEGHKNTTRNNQQQEGETVTNFFDGATYEEFEPQEEFEAFDSDYLGAAPTKAEENSAKIDPGAITLIQSTFLEKLHVAFASVAKYALNLLYLFAVLELVVFGLIWALQRDVGWDKFFFKIIKIGLIFFIIQNYSWLLGAIMHSFAKLAGVVTSGAVKYIFNPAKIWEYGYDSGIHLLQLAVTNNNFGTVLVLISLGLGILLFFGLLGIQMVIQMVGFYLVSFGALILLPFGAFTLSRNMLDKAVQAVLQAGIRLMVLIIIIGIAVVVWDGFQLVDMTTTTEFNINQSLGLFFTALLFLCLAYYLPKVLSQAVGSFGSELSYGTVAPPVVVNESTTSMLTTGEPSNIHAATAIEATNTLSPGGYMIRGGEVSGVTVTAAQPVVGSTVGVKEGIDGQGAKETAAQASYLAKSISERTVKKIKEEVLKAKQEKNN